MRALVTGAAGFVGQWLCRELLQRDWEVTGTLLQGVPSAPILSTDERGRVRWVPADLRRPSEIQDALQAARPDAIFHLAGITFVPGADADPSTAFDVNTVAASRLLSAVQTRRAAGALDPVVLIVGSAEQYGRHPLECMPLAETAQQRPLSVYGASKAAQEVVALQAFRSDGVRVVATRSFNHSGPGQADHFLLPALVRRALALARSGRGTAGGGLTVGNVTPVRDFLHVSDVARAYVLLAERGAAGEAYNVASGTGVLVRTLAERVLALAGVDAKLQPDPSLTRSAEIPVLVGDATKLRAATHWAPTRSLDNLIEDLIRATAH